MADEELQALLDPGDTGRGIRILKRSDSGNVAGYYVRGNLLAPGKSRWVETHQADSDETKNAIIREALGIS